jgi:hypothetical protein
MVSVLYHWIIVDSETTSFNYKEADCTISEPIANWINKKQLGQIII